MGKVIVSTVGVGSGVEHAIAKPIHEHNPDLSVYLATKESINTIENVETLLDKPIKSEIIIVDDEADFEKCYTRARDLLIKLIDENYRPQDIIVNFTSGTKPMSSGLLLAAVSLECASTIYVHGKRDENGKVITGTERVMSLSPTEVIADNRRQQAITQFNQYQYEACLNIVEEVRAMTADPDIINAFEGIDLLAKAYSSFDRFDHQAAMETLKEIDDETLESLNLNLYKNKRILHREIECKKYCLETVADLLENARRRGEEGKFDDAVARLYRTLELIAQVRLWKEHNIDASDVDIQRVPKEYRDHYEQLRNRNGTISLGLRKDYRLLEHLDDEMGHGFKDNKELLDLLDARNYSILAHGTQPLDKDKYQRFYGIVEDFAYEYYPELEELVEMARFPKI